MNGNGNGKASVSRELDAKHSKVWFNQLSFIHFFFPFSVVSDICCEPKCNFYWLIKNKFLQVISVVLKPHNPIWHENSFCLQVLFAKAFKKCNFWEKPQNILKGTFKISINFCIMQLIKSDAKMYIRYDISHCRAANIARWDRNWPIFDTRFAVELWLYSHIIKLVIITY